MIAPIQVDYNSLNLVTLAPMSITLIGAIFILVLDLIKSNLDRTLYVVFTILTLFLSLAASVSVDLNTKGLFDMILIDGVATLGEIIILIGSILFIPLALSKKQFHEFTYPEYFSLFLFMVFGFQFMVSSTNLIMIFIGLETASLALYTLIAMHNTKPSIEASIKYFTMGAMAAGFYAIGSAAIYGLTGSVDIVEISKILGSKLSDLSMVLPVVGGLLLLLVAIAFKVSLIPFHMWTPDAYEGATAPMAGYMSIVPKIAMMVVALRLFDSFIDINLDTLKWAIIMLSIVTTTLANMMALVQEDVKRMLAYSSISHAGFIMVAIALGSTKGYASMFIYYALFLFTNMGAFTILWLSRSKKRRFHQRYYHPYEKFAGMISKSPASAVIMAIFMLSLAGVPPFSIFWGKLYILSAIIDKGYYLVALILALNSAIAAYYYLKLIIYVP